ncbi:DUF5776 domain-containing protein [Lentilactobacillus hilgardii]|uniref:DUF5776 domain-containing protein n=1 Tax=Lentilactobacillus hilgardii TaxID=1588 RepID=UPI0039EC450D
MEINRKKIMSTGLLVLSLFSTALYFNNSIHVSAAVQQTAVQSTNESVTAPTLDGIPSVSNFYVDPQETYIFTNSTAKIKAYPYNIGRSNKQLYGFYIVLPKTLKAVDNVKGVQKSTDDFVKILQSSTHNFNITSLTVHYLGLTNDKREVYYFRPNDGATANDIVSNPSSWATLKINVQTAPDTEAANNDQVIMNANNTEEIPEYDVLFAGTQNYQQGGAYTTIKSSKLIANAPDNYIAGIQYGGIRRTLTYVSPIGKTIVNTFNIYDADTKQKITKEPILNKGKFGASYAPEDVIGSLDKLGLSSKEYNASSIKLYAGAKADPDTASSIPLQTKLTYRYDPSIWGTQAPDATDLTGLTYSVYVSKNFGDISAHNGAYTIGSKWDPLSYIDKITDSDGTALNLKENPKIVQVDETAVKVNTAGQYPLTFSFKDKNGHIIKKTITITVSNPSSSGGSTTTGSSSGPLSVINPSGDSTSPSNTASSSSESSVSSNVTPAEPSYASVQGKAIYAMKNLYLYSGTSFSSKNRIAFYAKKARNDRPMFVVEGYARSSTGKLRYQVKDVNHSSKTQGKVGYITASQKYVRPVYYQKKHSVVTVINPQGITAYRKANLTKRVRNYRQGTVLHVRRIVTHNLTTRYVLTNGHYITANRKMINMGRHKQVKMIRTKHAINRYTNADLTKKNRSIAKNQKVKVYGYDYSQGNNLAKQGVLRYRVAGGCVTANTKYVRAYR